MKKFQRKLSTLPAWQIAALAVAALTVGLLASVTLGGVVATLLTPVNYSLAGAVGCVISIGGVIWSSLIMTRPFVRAYFARQMEDAVHAVFVQFVEDKEKDRG